MTIKGNMLYRWTLIQYEFLRSDKKWSIWDWDNDPHTGLLIWSWLWFIDAGNNRTHSAVTSDNASRALPERATHYSGLLIQWQWLLYESNIWNKKELKLFGIIPRLVDHKNNIMWNYLYLCNKDLQCDITFCQHNRRGHATQTFIELIHNWFLYKIYLFWNYYQKRF